MGNEILRAKLCINTFMAIKIIVIYSFGFAIVKRIFIWIKKKLKLTRVRIYRIAGKAVSC